MAKYVSNTAAHLSYELDLGDKIETWNVTPAAVRECVLNYRVSSGPGVDRRYMPPPEQLQNMTDRMQFAVNRGQMIDFGFWPNDMIREVAGRAGILYGQGALGHPFRSPYLIIHSWHDPKLPFGKMLNELYPDNPAAAISTCVYLVHPLDSKTPGDLCVDFEATLFEGITINGAKLLAVGDRVLLDAQRTREHNCYSAKVIPFLARFPELYNNRDFAEVIAQLGSNRDGGDVMRAAINNVCDPVMTALLLLNTRNVTYKTVAAPLKLNKARARRGKPPIPPYRQVDSASYVTAVMDRIQHVKKPPTGTHASPLTHVRLGHWRHFDDGSKTHVRDALVNATAEARENFRAGRSHYEFKK